MLSTSGYQFLIDYLDAWAPENFQQRLGHLNAINVADIPYYNIKLDI